MSGPPQITDYLEKRDREHLRLLAIFHFVVGGLCIGGMGFLFLHYYLMHSVFANPEMWKGKEAQAPPKEFLEVFVWFYVFMGAMLVAAAVGNLLSGICLLKRKARTFSLIVAGLDCLMMPFGTVLGVFTIIVLLRDSVRPLYGGTQTNTILS